MQASEGGAVAVSPSEQRVCAEDAATGRLPPLTSRLTSIQKAGLPFGSAARLPHSALPSSLPFGAVETPLADDRSQKPRQLQSRATKSIAVSTTPANFDRFKFAGKGASYQHKVAPSGALLGCL